ncbi:MAG: L-aspartate oxidase [Candidatus Thorarchaeota archaeon]
MMETNKLLTSDILIIGSGISGLLFALKASEHGSVNLVTKRGLSDTATNRAQGGIAAVIADKDSFKSHIEDTIRVGAGLCHRDVVESFVKSGPDRINDLVELGVEFCQDEDCGEYDLGLEGGHSSRRVLHVKDHTGEDIQSVLTKQIQEAKNVDIFENHLAVNLFSRNGVVLGSYILDNQTLEIKRFAAKATVLATGGAGKVFLYTSNPDIATGDGIAMAYRAGATISNMEFMQFHPTMLYHHQMHSFLISEALRGEGAVLLGPDEERFMPNYHKDAELAPRDIVARAIDSELKRTGAEHMNLDISSKDSAFVKDRFPAIYETCLSGGIDITQEPIPVVPGVHYSCGGIRVDTFGRTDVKGLYAIGETTCTGFHGANRMASNSLLEGAVMAHNASQVVCDSITSTKLDKSIPPWDPGHATDPDELVVVSHLWDEVRRLMFNYVGIVRSNKRLMRARDRLEFLNKEINAFYWDFKLTPDLVELRNIAQVAELIVRMARMRKESRGTHYNRDHPEPSDEAVDTVMKKGYLPI